MKSMTLALAARALALGMLVPASAALLGTPAIAQTKKPAPKPAAKPAPKPAPNQIKGQAQQKGGPGVFGEVYSLKSGWNLSIESAAYSIATEWDQEAAHLDNKHKYIVMRARVKNATPTEQAGLDNLDVTFVDSDGQSHQHFAPVSRATTRKLVAQTLKPGQGLDDLRIVAPLPSEARIVKIIINQGRVAVPGEEVIRYFVAGATEAEAGGKPDPRNVIAPIPAPYADPKDPKGFTPLENAPGRIGAPTIAGLTEITLLGTSRAAKFGDQEAEEGKQILILSLKLKNAWGDTVDMEGPLSVGLDVVLVDSEGEEIRAESLALMKGTREEPVGAKKLRAGEEYPVRVVLNVPKGARFKTMTIGWSAGASHGIVYQMAGQ